MQTERIEEMQKFEKILNFKLELYRNFEFFSNFEKRTCNIVNKNCCKSYIFIHENTCI